MNVTLRNEITYFENYADNLNEFMYKESRNLTIREYMLLVLEVEKIKEFIKQLKKKFDANTHI